MCDPVTIGVIAVTAGVGVMATGTAAAVGQQQSREAQKDYAKENAQFQRNQIRNQLQQETESNAQRNYELARTALIAKGEAGAQNLGERSVRAIGRAIGFELGQDKATVQKNQEIATQTAAARLRGVDITLASNLAQIGDTSGMQLGLDITGAALGGLTTGLSIAGGLSQVTNTPLTGTLDPAPLGAAPATAGM